MIAKSHSRSRAPSPVLVVEGEYFIMQELPTGIDTCSPRASMHLVAQVSCKQEVVQMKVLLLSFDAIQFRLCGSLFLSVFVSVPLLLSH